jgi:DNA-binding winged helix-turn-helix (wHTH) protein/TolB-like protein/Flp pilus assembly protein TadD
VTEPGRRYGFGPFLLDTGEHLLLRDGQAVPLTIKAFELLTVLVENRGHLVLKEELLRQVWPETAVEENNLTVTISALRKALGEGPADRHYIETVPRRGYRFVAEVRQVDGGVTVSAEPGRRRRRWIRWAAALGTVTLLAAAAAAWRRSSPPPEATSVRSIAVLPFRAIGGGEGEYLGLGLADALITRLGSVRLLIVRSTGSVAKYAAADLDPLTAGRELRVDAVLEGTIQTAGDRLRATVRLLGVSDGSTLWAGTFDEPWSDIFTVQDAISQRVAEALALQLTTEQRRRLTRRDTRDSEAYQLYLKGRFFWNKRSREGFRRGLMLFEEAVAKDPGYALAYAGVADSHIGLSFYEYAAPHDAMPRARAAALQALDIADSAEAHASLAHVKSNYEWDWRTAEREWQQAIALDPEYGTARQWYANHYLAPQGRLEEAIAEARRARDLDPLSPVFNAFVGATLFFARRDDEAIEECRKTIDLYPEFGVGHWYLGRAFLRKGRFQEGLAELQQAVRLSGDSPLMKGTLGYGYAVSGQRPAAVAVLGELERLRAGSYASALDLAALHAALGDRERAFQSLEDAAAERSFHLVYLKLWPELDSLRPDPRFAAMVRRVGLER